MNHFYPDAALEIRRLRAEMPDRRERIATAALAGLFAYYGAAPPREAATYSVEAADALIAELDKEVKP